MNKYMKIIIIIILIIIIYFCKSYNNENYYNETNTLGIYTAIIIEPRKHKAMEFVMQNFTDMLDKRWNFIIFHGNQNEEYIKNIIDTKLKNNSDRIKLINLNIDNLSINDYNALLYDKKFYDMIPTEIFLIFQTDSMICSDFKDNIYKFINYDYVGAPWKDNQNVGNGGLSLRKKNKMIEIIDKCEKRYTEPNQLLNEDVFFSTTCADIVNINKPNFEDSKQFSIEQVYSDNSFGIHKAWLWHNDEVKEKINKKCTGFNELTNLQ
jgi:hypothetical protein